MSSCCVLTRRPTEPAAPNMFQRDDLERFYWACLACPGALSPLPRRELFLALLVCCYMRRRAGSSSARERLLTTCRGTLLVTWPPHCAFPSRTALCLCREDFSQLFATHEEWFRQATARRADTFSGLQSAVGDLCKTMTACESRNNAIVQQIGELDAIIDEERLKWQARLDKERSLLEKEKSALAAAERAKAAGAEGAS